jgi:hypothetical protein
MEGGELAITITALLAADTVISANAAACMSIMNSLEEEDSKETLEEQKASMPWMRNDNSWGELTERKIGSDWKAYFQIQQGNIASSSRH